MAVLALTREVTLPGTQHTWRIKADEMLEVDGDTFVKLETKNSSLSGLIGNKGGYMCLSRSHGYKALFELRNQESARVTQEELKDEGCSLFDEVKKIKVVKSRDDLRADRDNHRVVTILLGFPPCIPSNVVMLRQVHPLDSLFIKFEETSITAVLEYISSMLFESARRTRNPDQLPKGIKRHELGYLVRYKTCSGQHKHKLRRTMDAAIAFHADPFAEDEEPEEETHNE
jgi:hypothetical protein